METMTATTLQRVADGFEAFRTAAGFTALHDEADYARALALVEAILDATRNTADREDASHPLAALLDFLIPAIHDYESTHYSVPKAAPHEVLRFLMEQHGLTQSQLPEVGNQSVVSQVLAGKRTLNLRQITRLCARFGVGADVFLPQPQVLP